MRYLPGPAANQIHVGEVVRRGPDTGVCRAPVPVCRRLVVRRRHAPPFVEIDPEVVLACGNPASAPLVAHATACSYSFHAL
jgi:hypothetical protein